MQKLLAFLAAGSLYTVPLLLFAQQQKAIVPCDGVQCTCNDLGQLASNIMTWMLYTMVFISAGTFSYAGFKYLTSGMVGEAAQVESAKKMLKNVAKGLVLALLAWLIVDTTISTLGNSKLNDMWIKICS
ncbi:hypothetical protein EBR66_03490 [bacterium]|nr:hypothetical protein [bacterium]